MPANWEEEREDFLTRVAYIVSKFDVPKCLVLNMDETPLKWTSSSGMTWAKTNSDNVATQGAKDKRQATGTPWVTMEGDLVFFHTTIKGKTVRCLPSEDFRSKEEFNPKMGKILFGFSENHWVSKDTMKEQIVEADRYHKEIINEKGLDANQKMLIIWDVYCRHRDADLLEWIRKEYPNIIILFIPANLTEICQPLDIYFNALFKTILNRLMSQHIVDEWCAHNAAAETARIAECCAAGEETVRIPYTMKTKISDTKVRFYTLLNKAVTEMRIGGKEKIKDHAWAQFEKCYDRQYQFNAAEKVGADRSGKYFKHSSSSSEFELEDTIVSRFQRSLTFEISMTHETIPTREDDLQKENGDKFIGRLVRDYAGKPWPGYVHKKHRKRASSNQLGEMIFTVKYYAGIIDRDKRAKKNVEYTWKELLDELITADNAVRFDPIVPAATENVTPTVVENQQNE